MYFGGLQGVNAFYPEELTKKEKEKRQAPVLFTGLAKFDSRVDSLITQKKKLRSDSTIGLTHNDQFFTFEYALADYTNPHTTRYSYMLEGYETNWSAPSMNNQARYFNIPAGDYTFRVRAIFENGKWNKEELAIPIHVKQAFYQTWWFILLSALLLSALLYILFKYRIYSVEKRRQQLENEVNLRTNELAQEKEKSDKLLLNILPAGLAEELKAYGKAKAKRHENVTVFFSDFEGFTKIASQLSPEELVAEIDKCFREFDEIIDAYGLEKIKTIGDAYMCAGIPKDKGNNAVSVVKAALDIQAYMNALAYERKENKEIFFEARIGIHTGSVVAGIVGSKKFAYDIWGDTVNIAARMEGNGEVGKVNISAATYELVKDSFDCTYRGKINVKNKGMVDMYFVDGRKHI